MPIGALAAARQIRQMPCGFTTDCAPWYDAASVLASAAEWNPTNTSHAYVLRQRRRAAMLQCSERQKSDTTLLRSGAWCLSAPIEKTASSANRWAAAHHSGGRVALPNNMSYLMPLGHYQADAVIVGVLAALLRNRIPHLARADRPQSVNDFGAGVGQYGRSLKAIDATIDWRGYDGAGNVEDFTGGFVRFFDLTLPLSLPRADWVLSLEVGEHVPRQFEAMYLRNLAAHACTGVIGSWATLGQRGRGHVNNHNASYIEARFAEIGFRADTQLRHLLRHGEPGLATPPGPHYRQLQRNIFAFVRDRPLRRGCHVGTTEKG